MSEAKIQREIQLRASELGHRLWRNNVGTAETNNGSFIRFGLCVGSCDLIGLTNDGRFLAVEVKGPTTRIRKAQRDYIALVRSMGGIAGVCRSVNEFERLVERG